MSFSPLCGFSATYVLNQAGSHFGLAWYNDTGTQPTAADLHVLVPANSAVGTMFNGTAIKSDPAYTGGVVGFALVGGETHYTNDAYDTVCTSCSPPGPWITALMYASTVTPNAYYICFEDGPTSATGWNNDGDFNDDVYFLTGVTCQGGGQPCDTGKPGICAAGLTQCAASGTTCQQLNQPSPTETCNGLDDNCNGTVDEGAMCPDDKVCEMGHVRAEVRQRDHVRGGARVLGRRVLRRPCVPDGHVPFGRSVRGRHLQGALRRDRLPEPAGVPRRRVRRSLQGRNVSHVPDLRSGRVHPQLRVLALRHG